MPKLRKAAGRRFHFAGTTAGGVGSPDAPPLKGVELGLGPEVKTVADQGRGGENPFTKLDLMQDFGGIASCLEDRQFSGQ